ncbi:TetR/AcrR family transcriptional regulator [Flexivirga oryzae]|uniref:AcrR family transcriptional regulator n=1 Tax=Flexivirga oryzae TaxID=1794944 RepID=A0A839N105_9MICO|nr:TetR family transcriptional regulator C-terminal domain-containing protein [Flexivirga oryzae]MBB2891388.1 AcrR family transcriptional regulator [Flexivirga oryzae]
MPKLVDHDARREEIVDAVMRVVARDGYAGLSVRTVAQEAGWSPGSIRHYFRTQQELIGFAMTTLSARVRVRIERQGSRATDLDGVARLLEEILPLDSARRVESEVWLALAVAAHTDPELGAIWREVNTGLHGLMESCVLVVAELSGRALDIPAETDRLHALTDGLALHGTLRPRLSAARMRAALRTHLAELAAGR